MAEPKVESRGALAGAGVAVVLVLAVGTLAPRRPDPNLLFGVDGYRAFGPVAFLAAAGALLALLFLPGLAARIAALAARLRSLPPTAGTALVVVGAGAAFWLLPNHRLSGDAGSVLLHTALGDVYPSNSLTNHLFTGTARLLGLEPVIAIRLVSTLAGMVYAGAAVALARECFPPGPRRAGLAALLLGSGSVALFFGTIEVYAPLAGAIAVYLWLGTRWLNGKGTGVGAPLTLGVAFALHGSAGLLLPSLVLLANRGRIRPLAWRRIATWAGLFLLPVLAAFAVLWFGTWGGEPPPPGSELTGTFLGVAGRAPLLPLVLSADDPLRRYALFDLEHAAGVLNLLGLVALPALALFVGGKRRIREPVFLFAGVVALFLVLFPVFWNISYDLSADWDLFSPMGIPLALLGGLAFFAGPRTGADAVRVAALSLFCLLPFVVGNHVSPRLRYDYAKNVAERMGIAVPLTVARAAASRALEGPGATEPRPPERGERVWRVDLEQFASRLPAVRDAFGPARIEGDLAELTPVVADALGRTPALADAVVAELGRTAREAPLEIRTAEAARVAAARPEVRRMASDVPDEATLEMVILDALDEGLERFGAYDLSAHEVDAAALRATARRGFTATFTGRRLDGDRWGDLLTDSLLAVLGPGEESSDWRSLLAAERSWAARRRALRPPGYDPAVRRVEWFRGPGRDPARAERHARHWLAKRPDDTTWLYVLGGLVLDRGEREEGRALLRRSIDANPANLLARIRLANDLVQTREFTGAEAVVARGLRLNGLHPQAPAALYQLAWLRLRRGEAKLAAGHLRAVLDRVPRSATAPADQMLRRQAEELLRTADPGGK